MADVQPLDGKRDSTRRQRLLVLYAQVCWMMGEQFDPARFGWIMQCPDHIEECLLSVLASKR